MDCLQLCPSGSQCSFAGNREHPCRSFARQRRDRIAQAVVHWADPPLEEVAGSRGAVSCDELRSLIAVVTEGLRGVLSSSSPSTLPRKSRRSSAARYKGRSTARCSRSANAAVSISRSARSQTSVKNVSRLSAFGCVADCLRILLGHRRQYPPSAGPERHGLVVAVAADKLLQCPCPIGRRGKQTGGRLPVPCAPAPCGCSTRSRTFPTARGQAAFGQVPKPDRGPNTLRLSSVRS